MALARDGRKDDYGVIAVIGDGSLTGGLALAALNQIGHVKPKMTIILNDNEMSISENVGALNHYLSTLQVQPWLERAEARGKKLLGTGLSAWGSRVKKALRRFIDPASANPFYAMGLRYVGPIDGHDVEQLRYYLQAIDKLEGPTMLHIVTKKGKGYKTAEADPIYWHGPPKFDMDRPQKIAKGYTWSNAFGDAATELAKNNDKLWVITPAMREGSGLVGYSREVPERYLDVGIAEDVAVTTAAGMALQGEKPIVAIYSTFLQRGFDQVIHDVCLENLDVVFAIDRAGLVGGDGMTHQGVYDIAYLRSIPNMSIAMPRDAEEQRAMLKKALELGGPKAIRWPRGKVAPASDSPSDTWQDIAWGSWEVLKEGSRAYILAIGSSVDDALEASRHLPEVGVVNARFIKPLDTALLHDLALSVDLLVTVEDHVRDGGFGSAVAEFLSDHAYPTRLKRLGIPDVHVEHGNPSQQHEDLGYGPTAIQSLLETELQRQQKAFVF